LKKVNLYTPINSLGYGVVGYNVWKNLREKADVTLWAIQNEQQIAPPVQVSEEVINKIREDVDKQSDFHNATCLKIWHENQLGHRIGSGKFVALPFFEISKLNHRRLSHLKSADEIIVTSSWARDVLLNQKNSDQTAWQSPYIHVIPCGVDREIFNENGCDDFPVEKCIFFNCGKWEIRKGHDVLYKAFNAAFDSHAKVELWMMNENPFLSPEETNSWHKLYRNPKIKMLDRVQYQHELADIMKQTYCGVFPARAEGWNLEALEMMATGKHLIITDYSAHTEFCNEKNSRLINITQEEPMYDGKWFLGDNGNWASLEGDAFDQLVNHMREVYESWRTERTVNENGIQTSKELSWERCATKISEVL